MEDKPNKEATGEIADFTPMDWVSTEMLAKLRSRFGKAAQLMLSDSEFGAPDVGLAHAAGLGVLWKWLRFRPANDSSTVAVTMARAIVTPLVMLGLGGLVHLFM